MQQKGHHGDLLLRVDMCCEACVKKVRKVLIELNGTDSIHSCPSVTTRLIVTSDVYLFSFLKFFCLSFEVDIGVVSA